MFLIVHTHRHPSLLLPEEAPAGDLALREFVLAVKTNLRDQDIFARAGGDEFRIILPATLPAGAALVAERIRASVNAIEIRNEKGSTRLSISAGICSCLPGDESLDDVTKRADAALYMAKAGGRNRVHPVFHPHKKVGTRRCPKERDYRFD